ncbi:protein MAIN-LIKE 1-like [Vicia villosa]|uniref:protein MAIN-LIKE 1-like n=1 Tax=Vicia villosa TaxID=3911 RepID=UPI00273CB211|nr:protein MAIN-LIKE 1-like [Vicia villosa]
MTGNSARLRQGASFEAAPDTVIRVELTAIFEDWAHHLVPEKCRRMATTQEWHYVEGKMRTLGPDGRPHTRRRRDEAGSSNPPPQPPQPVGYPGGPSDLSLLVRYQDHVARRLWYGEKRGPKKELKVAGHGTKLQERVPQQLPPKIEAIVTRSGLASLQRTSLTKIDVNLVSAFVERWHVETSSFHMPFGEMTITLDDVACLLHLPINGMFWYPDEHVTEQVAVDLGCELLGVDRHAMAVHVRSYRGAYYSLQWLYDRFVQYRAAGSWTYATRAYLMMLVGSTIFADKTFTLVEARYLLLIRDLRGLGSYSWASAALATLYRHLGDASMFSCKQLSGYPTLLQCAYRLLHVFHHIFLAFHPNIFVNIKTT